MTIIFDGTQGITTPAETANNSVTTPVVKSGSALTLQTNGSTTAVTIDTSQNVGIGTVSPQMRVDVNGGVRVQSITNPTSGSGMELAYDGTQGIIQAYSNRTTLASVPVYLVTGQLKFPPTQNPSSDANTLDDYEEGTWTPVLAASNSGPTVTYTVQQGRYTKIGRTVFIECYLRLTSYSGGSGNAKVGGLPFTSAGQPYGYMVVGENTGITVSGTYYTLQGGVDASGTTVTLLKAAPNAATTAVNLTEIGSSTTVYLIFSGTYTASA
jgi:hypothetical protein